jgi:acyl-coenzyme A thioesterase PaaI-like protein
VANGMPEYADIALVDLIVDPQNARLREKQPNEQAALLAVARKDKRHLLNIAADIVTRRIATVEAKVRDGDENLVALGTGTFRIFEKRGDPIV